MAHSGKQAEQEFVLLEEVEGEHATEAAVGNSECQPRPGRV
jgi:hypothetical protein